MKLKNGIYSLSIGIIQQLVTLVCGLIIPRLFIRTYGSEMNGFLSSIGNLYSYLALLEAGVGTAAIQALYGPVGCGDKSKINGIMAAVSRWYNKAGFLYFLSVICISIIYPLTVSTSIPFWTIFTISILNGMGGVLNFWVHGKYLLLLQAEGKKYLISLLTMAVYILSNITKITLLLMGYDVIAIHVGYFAIGLLQMLLYLIYINKNYPWINLKVLPNTQALGQSRAVFVQEIMRMICSNTDILVLTYVARDLKTVSVYTIYLMIYNTVEKLFSTLFGSFHYLLGQMYNTDKARYLSVHRRYEAISMAASFALYTIAYSLTTPFLTLYTAGITDAKYVDPYLPLLFTVMHLLSSSREASSRVINFAGHFKQMQGRAILEAAINFGCSVVLVQICGIYGVLLGTIIAYLYRTVDIILYANHQLLNRSIWQTYRIWLTSIAVFCGISLLPITTMITVSSYGTLFLLALAVGVIVSVIYMVVFWIIERDSVIFLMQMVREILRKRKK